MREYERITNPKVAKNIEQKVALCFSPSLQRKHYKALAELEDQIENGTLVDTTEKFITEETIKDRKRYLICEHHLTETIVDFADTQAEAEKKLKEKQNER